MWSKLKRDYLPLRASEESQPLAPEQKGDCHCQTSIYRPKLALFFATAVNVVILALSICYYNDFWVSNSVLRQTSSYTPIYDLVDLKLQSKQVNGTIFPPKGEQSIARQPPNDEADALWKEYEITRIIPVTRDDILKMGKDPETAVKLEDDMWGLGDDKYATILDVYHQIHCLNSLRMIAYGNYYNESQGRTDAFGFREIHINHCADILLQALQCSGNVNLITLHWVEEQTIPFPDMSVNRQCIDFDGLTEWRKTATLDQEKFDRLMWKPEGVAQLPAPDDYYEHYGGDNPNHKNGAHPDDDFNL